VRPRPFDSVLVANRGEIARRVLRGVRAQGLRGIAVFSDADADSPHVAEADAAVRIGPAPASESYLSVEALIVAARRSGAEAVHPGYGFLSERATFAQAVLDAGLVWIGPPPSAIEAMGDKDRAKERMRAAGVPVVPGFDALDPTEDELVAAGLALGFPLLVKAAAGGGGRGMRRVDGPEGLRDALRSARHEAEAAFGQGRLLLERLVLGARHVEVQVLADAHGNVVHLHERDCSVQRRHQKVLEEAPSPAVGPALRAAMGAAAVAAARAVGYQNAGTVEFLLDPEGEFCFLEMNTRLQVEHPVTELITGLDLVALQLQVAAGEPLPFGQADVPLRGHAIEARLCCEDPAAGDAPSTGRIRRFWAPAGDGLRVDAGIGETADIGPHYDPMVAKLIAWGPDRDTARRRLRRLVEDTVVIGVKTNRPLLVAALSDPDFAAGAATTAFLAERPQLRAAPSPSAFAIAAGVAHLATRGGDQGLRLAHAGPHTLPVTVDGRRVDAQAEVRRGAVRVALPGAAPVEVRLLPQGAEVDGLRRALTLLPEGDGVHVQEGVCAALLTPWDPRPAAAGPAAGDGRLRAPMASKVLAVKAAVGDRVAAGQPVLILEAMKLETALCADQDSVVVELRATPGASVAAGAVLAVLQPADPA